jgi:hypothetical protein
MKDAPDILKTVTALENSYRDPEELRIIQPLAAYEKVKAGDVYEFTRDVWARSGHIFEEGDQLKVIESTGQTPWGEIGPDGCNWKVDAGNGYTVWATLEQCISRGLLVKVS